MIIDHEEKTIQDQIRDLNTKISRLESAETNLRKSVVTATEDLEEHSKSILLG